MKKIDKSIIVLTVICLIVSIALAAVNFVTAPVIEEANAKAVSAACFLVMPQAKDFEELKADALPDGLPGTVSNVYREVGGLGYAIKLTTKGYGTGFVILCGIAADGTVTGTTVVSSNETPSIGGRCFTDAYMDQYLGKTAALEGVQGISGATYTSRGYQSAIVDAFAAFAALEGGAGQ